MRREKINIVLPALLFTMIVSSCAGLKRAATNGDSMGGSFEAKKFYGEVGKLNLTGENFRFDRVKVESRNNDETIRFSGNIRYSKEGKILFSARTIGNIELARLYLDNERIIIVDRINRVYSTGNTSDYLERYGLSWNDIIILFGDLPQEVVQAGRVRCENGFSESEAVIAGRKATITMDCLNKKMKEISVTEGGNRLGELVAIFSEIRSADNVVYPALVSVAAGSAKFGLEIEYDRYKEFDGIIKRPERPSGYEIMKL